MIFLILLYVVSLHMAISLGWVFLEVLSINLLVLIVLWPAILRRRPWAYATCAVAALFASGLALAGHAHWLFYWPPVLIPTFLCWVFARSLRAGRVPVVTYIAGVLRDGDMPREVRQYTRQVTAVWALLLALLAVIHSGLALWGDRALWSFVTNVLFYAVMALAFLVEHAWHRLRFSHLHHPGFRDFVRGLVRIDYRQLY